ncbi:hypothetical protein HK101_005221, partial [Irineochytrium annulatum]
MRGSPSTVLALRGCSGGRARGSRCMIFLATVLLAISTTVVEAQSTSAPAIIPATTAVVRSTTTAALPTVTPTPAVSFPQSNQNNLYAPCVVCVGRESLCPTYQHDCPADPTAIKTIHVLYGKAFHGQTLGSTSWAGWSLAFTVIDKAQHELQPELLKLDLKLGGNPPTPSFHLKLDIPPGDSYELHEVLNYTAPGSLTPFRLTLTRPIYYITVDLTNGTWPTFLASNSNHPTPPPNTTDPATVGAPATSPGQTSLWIAVVVTAALVVVVGFGAIYIIQRLRKRDRGPKLSAEEQAAFDARVEAAVAARIEAEFEARRQRLKTGFDPTSPPSYVFDTELGAITPAGVKVPIHQTRSLSPASATSPDRRNSRTESYVSNGSNNLLVRTSNVRSLSPGSSFRSPAPPSSAAQQHAYPPHPTSGPQLPATDLPP